MTEGRKTDRKTRALIWFVALTALVVALYGAVVYTEQPRFCNVCHEMTPYYSAWNTGGHTTVSCIMCHVAPGPVARFSHKFVALKEVWDHFTTTPRFPMNTAEVPDSRCTTCHDDAAAWDTSGFSHELHADAGSCQHCHASTGHKVTFAALDSAGILAPGMQPEGAEYVGQIDAGQGTPSTIAGHKTVPCSGCHPMAQMQCSMCHQPPADHYGTQCSSCHSPGTPFAQTVFDHPRTGEHGFRSFPCTDCHPDGFGSATCTKCHEGGAPADD